jgi:hypothetical protein
MKAQCSTKAHTTKAHLSASLADKTKAQRSIKAHPTKAHRLVIQVDQNDPAVTNVIEYYPARGEDVDVDVIIYAACTCACRYIAGTGPHQEFEGFGVS